MYAKLKWQEVFGQAFEKIILIAGLVATKRFFPHFDTNIAIPNKRAGLKVKIA
jgi:hypothetical protein